MIPKFRNSLLTETSPYLLQHAHNPVNWIAWNEKALFEAKEKNKLILISIGYAACHWCHVMEKESFEDEEVAEIMNDLFINVKVDREERPDVDQVYMTALQLMRGQGGWPLNIIALPDGRPIWGGTYFSKDIWVESLQQVEKLYRSDPQRVLEYATHLQEGMEQLESLITDAPQVDDLNKLLKQTVANWKTNLDYDWGGINQAPKFMMPVNFEFLLRYSDWAKDKDLLKYVHLTLTKMAYGGIYDHIGGGFARYSVDKRWHIPHFEKMLYDNAQLVSLYSKAYLQSKDPLYEQVVRETLGFIEREFRDKSGLFYSSLDADSLDTRDNMAEGAFYVWTKDELEDLLQDDFKIVMFYYNINDFGYWENGNYVLIRTAPSNSLAHDLKISEEELQKRIARSKKVLLKARSKRIRPWLDDKCLTAWNALMIKGYADAYKAFGDASFKERALQTGEFIKAHLQRPEGGLWRSYRNGKVTITAFMEDYAQMTDAILALYEISGELKWLDWAKGLTNYVLDCFYSEDKGFFYFTSNADPILATRTWEREDTVIPASNSVMAHVLFKLSYYLDNTAYEKIAAAMLYKILPLSKDRGDFYANWLLLAMNINGPYFQVVVSGKQAGLKTTQLMNNYMPMVLWAQSDSPLALTLFRDRWDPNLTQIFVCKDKSCHLPTTDTENALSLILEADIE